MGTTLTGTTPQDTYDSLIKVTDNGPLSGTAKYLSDGLGNDSALAVSTAAVGVGTTTIASGSKLTVGGPIAAVGSAGTMATFETSVSACFIGLKDSSGSLTYLGSDNGAFIVQTPSGGYSTKLTLTDAGNVGIGTSSPSTKFVVSNGGAAGLEIEPTGLLQSYNRSTGVYQSINLDGSNILFRPSGTERARITSDGLTFNGDTAAANALDDYEEGTWTMGITFGGAAVGVTTSNNTGTYTKIGRQVTVNGVLILTSKGSSTGVALITGLPFTVGNANGYYPSVTLRMENVTFANQFQAYGGIGSTVIALDEITEAGVNTELNNNDFANNSTVMVNLTYFV